MSFPTVPSRNGWAIWPRHFGSVYAIAYRPCCDAMQLQFSVRKMRKRSRLLALTSGQAGSLNWQTWRSFATYSRWHTVPLAIATNCLCVRETDFFILDRTIGMDRFFKPLRTVVALCIVWATLANAWAGPALSTFGGITPEMIARLVVPLIAEAVPRKFEGEKDWGKTKKITTGLRSEGNFFRFDIHSKRSEVNDGVWKKYRVTLVEPDKNLEIRIDDLHRLESGKYALKLFVAAKVHGWARAVVYEHGVHLISLEAEGDTATRLWIDAEIDVATIESSTLIPGIELRPVVTEARLKFDDFKLKRISDVRGAVAKELGDLLRKELEKELSGKKLVNRLNRAFQKHPERLRLSPDMLLGKSAAKVEASP